MKKLLPLAVWIFFINSLLGIDLQNYRLVWDAEFNDSELNKNQWKISTGQRFDAVNCEEAIKLENGCLVISPFTKNGIHYTGTVTAEGIFEENYGYWESRVRFNTLPGAWSDIWLYSQTVALIEDDIDRAGTEIDIFEHRNTDILNKNIVNLLVHSLHYNGYSSKHTNYAKDGLFSYPSNEFHIIGLKWDKKGYTFYIDGKETWATNKGLTSKRLFPIISVEIKDHFWAGDILQGGYTGKPMMEVDYLRFYKEKE